jgi:hypothetical protein
VPQLYWRLVFGRTTETKPAADLARIVLGIAGLPGGYPVAAEILYMHFRSPTDMPVHWDPVLVDCGRQLLRTFAVDQDQQGAGYRLARIATICLRGPEAGSDASLICNRIVDASGTGFGAVRQLGELIEVLLTSHPQVALDCCLGGTQDRSPVLTWLLTRDEHRNPLGKVPIPILLDWAGQDPETRLPRLANVIPVLDTKADPLAWNEAALALLNATPDRATLFRRLAERLRPRIWGGSLADILERRRPLIQQFFHDNDPAVCQVAREIDSHLQREIAAEAAREVNRDERFE